MSGSSPRPAAAIDFESAGTDLASVLTRAQYESYFPHHHPLYSYEALMKAASGFPLFAGEGDVTVRKRELAAFFAEIAHETTNGGPGAAGGPLCLGPLLYRRAGLR